MKLLTLQQIQKSLNTVRVLISEVLTTTVDAITELNNKIPTKVSQLENDLGYKTTTGSGLIDFMVDDDGNLIVYNSEEDSVNIGINEDGNLIWEVV